MPGSRRMLAYDANDKPIIVEQPIIEGAMSVPPNVTATNLPTIVTAVNKILANQRTFATLLGLTITES